MCLAFPGRVVAREGDSVVVQTDGRRRRASALVFPDLAPGEWVFVSAGTVVGRLEPAEAAQIRDELQAARGEKQ